MIKIDISTLIFYYIFISVIIIICFWIISGYRKRQFRPHKDGDFMWRCSVCSHVYVDSRHDEISACPLCGSYNKKEVVEK